MERKEENLEEIPTRESRLENISFLDSLLRLAVSLLVLLGLYILLVWIVKLAIHLALIVTKDILYIPVGIALFLIGSSLLTLLTKPQKGGENGHNYATTN